VTSKTTPAGTTGYAYDNVNNLLTLTVPGGATSNYTYNAVNWVTQQDDRASGGALTVSYTFAYDANGNKTSETEVRPGKPNRVTSSTYDANNRLLTTTDPSGGTTTYGYDAVGNRATVTDPMGVSTALTYNAVNLPSQTTHTQNGATLDTTTNTYDARNNPQSQRTVAGNLTLTTTRIYNANNYLTQVVNSHQGIYSGTETNNVQYQDNNLVSQYGPVDMWGYNASVMYDAAERVNCWQNGGFLGPVWWSYYPNGNRRYFYSGYNPIRSCAVTNDPGTWYTASREEYFYTGQRLVRRETRNYGDLSTLYLARTYTYDSAGNVTSEVKVDYTTNTTTTLQYGWAWQGNANRLTTFTASNGVTTTLDYDSLGRITRRYAALGYSDYVYEDGTDWLVREVWHSAVSGNAFDRVRYRYANGRPDYVEIAQTPGDLSEVWSYDQRYLQVNWHGDLMRRVWLNGDGATEMAYDPWGNNVRGLHYYEWNGAWGYMAFGALQLYYVHGRWYNPDTALFLSPDRNSDYKYNKNQNALTKAWYGGPALISTNQQNANGRYIRTNYGAIIDYDHWNPKDAWDLIRDVETKKGHEFGAALFIAGPFGYATGTITAKYSWSDPISDVYGVALAIWEDYQIKFETAQDHRIIGTMASSFALEDLPTDYLSFYAAALAHSRRKMVTNRDSFRQEWEEILGMLDGVRTRDDREPLHCNAPAPECSSQNRNFTPRIEVVLYEIDIPRAHKRVF
jgi:YD repeat-containing protein